MKYYEAIFTTDVEPNLKFRIRKVSPIKLLSIATRFGDQDLASTEEVFKFALENTEVQVLDKWFPVKEANKEVYWPADIDENLMLLQELVAYFIKNVIASVFTKSSKSTN